MSDKNNYYSKVDLMMMTVKDLKSLAKENQIKGISQLRKDDLVKKLFSYKIKKSDQVDDLIHQIDQLKLSPPKKPLGNFEVLPKDIMNLIVGELDLNDVKSLQKTSASMKKHIQKPVEKKFNIYLDRLLNRPPFKLTPPMIDELLEIMKENGVGRWKKLENILLQGYEFDTYSLNVLAKYWNYVTDAKGGRWKPLEKLLYTHDKVRYLVDIAKQRVAKIEKRIPLDEEDYPYDEDLPYLKQFKSKKGIFSKPNYEEESEDDELSEDLSEDEDDDDWLKDE